MIFTSRSFSAIYRDDACNPPCATVDNTCCPAERVTLTLVPAVCPTDASASLRAVRSRELGTLSPGWPSRSYAEASTAKICPPYSTDDTTSCRRIPEIVAVPYTGVLRGITVPSMRTGSRSRRRTVLPARITCVAATQALTVGISACVMPPAAVRNPRLRSTVKSARGSSVEASTSPSRTGRITDKREFRRCFVGPASSSTAVPPPRYFCANLYCSSASAKGSGCRRPASSCDCRTATCSFRASTSALRGGAA